MITEKLQSAGMKAQQLMTPPDGEDVFSLLADGDGIGYWPGRAKIEVSPDPKYRQAVMRVTEAPHEITHEVEVMNYTAYPRGKTGLPLSTYDLRRSARMRFPVATPSGTEWSIRRTSYRQVTATERVTHIYQVTAKIPASEMTFLVGIDETAHFVSELPARAKNVREAHRLLKPDIVLASRNVKRQGEWFFVPVVDEGLIKRLEKSISLARWDYLENGNHMATCWHYDGKTYAFGTVIDTRRERHADLHLEGWHQVVRNREIANDFDRYD